MTQTLPPRKTRNGLDAVHLRQSSPNDLIFGMLLNRRTGKAVKMAWNPQGRTNADGTDHPNDLILE
jgi:hypothetical protein